MSTKLGLEGVAYRNTGTYESPTWSPMTNIKDLSVSLEKGEADVTTRAANGWEVLKATLRKAAIEFQAVWDPEDEAFAALLATFLGADPIEFAIMDGDITEAGSEGLRATMDVFKFTRNEQLTEAMTADISMKPTRADNAPEWMVIAVTTTTAAPTTTTGA